MSLAYTLSAAKQNAPNANIHLNFLDGIRALAALFVVMHHTWLFEQGIGTHSGVQGWLTNWLSYGHLAVDVFIVLSGFCLMLPVARSGQLKGGAIKFFGKRARRILPPFYAAIGLSVLLKSVLLRHGHFHVSLPFVLRLPHFGQSLAANVLLLQDLMPNDNGIDPPLWSVAVEWRIYFLFPLFVVIWQRYGSAATLAAAAAFSGVLMAIFHFAYPQLSLEHICPWYLILFSSGICAGTVAVQQEQGRVKWHWMAMGLAACVAFCLQMWPITSQGEVARYLSHLPVIDVLTGFLTACILIVLTRKAYSGKEEIALKFLSWRPLVFTGTFAYSIYLIHFPLILLFLSLFDHVHAPGALAPFRHAGFNLISRPAVVGCSYLFFLVCERPFLNSRRVDGAARTQSALFGLQKENSLIQ